MGRCENSQSVFKMWKIPNQFSLGLLHCYWYAASPRACPSPAHAILLIEYMSKIFSVVLPYFPMEAALSRNCWTCQMFLVTNQYPNRMGRFNLKITSGGFKKRYLLEGPKNMFFLRQSSTKIHPHSVSIALEITFISVGEHLNPGVCWSDSSVYYVCCSNQPNPIFW